MNVVFDDKVSTMGDMETDVRSVSSQNEEDPMEKPNDPTKRPRKQGISIVHSISIQKDLDGRTKNLTVDPFKKKDA